MSDFRQVVGVGSHKPQPVFKMLPRRQGVRLATVAGRVGQYKVVNQVAWVERVRNEVVDIGLFDRLAAIVAAAADLPQARSHYCQGLARGLKQEGLQVAVAPHEMVVPAVALDVIDPVAARKPLNQGLKASQAEGNAGKQRYTLFPCFKQKHISYTSKVLQILDRLRLDGGRDGCE